jgi:hypothetical protein
MRVVLGVSLTAASAVWVLVDTHDGSIIADEVVPLESLNDMARATARSVQAFALQTDTDIDGVRLVWSDDARQHGIRLRTKLRLFGFETVETVTEEAARKGRNRTARHIAPHMVMAYGAARSTLDAAEGRSGVLRRLVSQVPSRNTGDFGGEPHHLAGRFAGLSAAVGDAATQVSGRVRNVTSAWSHSVPARVAGGALVAAVVGVVGWLLIDTSPPPPYETTDTAVAEAVAPVPAVVAPAPVLAGAVPAPVAAPPEAAAPEAAQIPEYRPEPAVAAAPEAAQIPEYRPEPAVAAAPEVVDLPVAEVTASEISIDPGVDAAAPEQASTIVGVPHLSGTGPVTGPAQPVAQPAQAIPESVTPAPPAPAGPLGALFRALP